MSIELLQEIGLNKYEAEAYYTLLTEGPLTGYELGKRSQVPLSRSYDVLERLSQKGLALAQPGEPARYQALEPELFLGQVRSTMEQTLHTLAETLAEARQPVSSDEFWVVRGYRHILLRARALCTAATQALILVLPEKLRAELTTELAEAQQRGVSLTLAPASSAATFWLLRDEREALLGTLTPEDQCQAILSANPALLAVLTTSLSSAPATASAPGEEQRDSTEKQPDWLEWEQRKQQRLRKGRNDQRIA
jgi:predicted transcriptional regulator